MTAGFPQSTSPGNEQRDYWSSDAADAPGSCNTPGIKDPVVDALIDRIIFAADREDLVAATRALDRVLLVELLHRAAILQPTLRYAYWDKFGIPDEQPSYAGIDTMAWWVISGAPRRRSRKRSRTRPGKLNDPDARPRPPLNSSCWAASALAVPLLARDAFAPNWKTRTPLPAYRLSAILKIWPGISRISTMRIRKPPKGGRITHANCRPGPTNQAPDTFDTLNSYVLRGTARSRNGPDLRHADDGLGRTRWEPIMPMPRRAVSVSDDRLTWQFRLREDAAFPTTVPPSTADDVVFSIHHLAGMKATRTWPARCGQIEAIDAPDERTVSIRLHPLAGISTGLHDSRGLPDHVARLVGRADLRRHFVRCAPRLRPAIASGASISAATSSSTGRGWMGSRPARLARPLQFRPHTATTIFVTATASFEAFFRRDHPVPRGSSPRAKMGQDYNFPPILDGPRESRTRVM